MLFSVDGIEITYCSKAVQSYLNPFCLMKCHHRKAACFAFSTGLQFPFLSLILKFCLNSSDRMFIRMHREFLLETVRGISLVFGPYSAPINWSIVLKAHPALYQGSLHLRSENGQDWLARISLRDLRPFVVVAKVVGQVTYSCNECVHTRRYFLCNCYTI